jgi:type IX secretion system PorP/SprF family membrane protein
MKRTFKTIGILSMMVFMATGGAFGQQLPQFSQYIFNGLHVNPGYAGYKGEPYIQSTYRSQWGGFPGAPETFTVTADLSANEGTMGFGISLLSDQLGPARTTTGMLTYAYRIQTGRKSFLGMGASVGLSEYMMDGELLDPNDPNDPEIPGGRINMFTPNLNSGLFFHSDKFYAGFSVYNMIGRKALEREDIALAYHDFHYYLTAGAMLRMSDNVGFKPSFLFRQVKGAPTNYDINGMFVFFDRLLVGGSYRSNMKLWTDVESSLTSRNAVAAVLEVYATDRLRLGYAYDQSLNVLQDYRHNSHELSLGFYMTPRTAKMKNQRWF